MVNTHTESKNVLRIAADIGGTFTDGVAVMAPAGRIWVGKTPTTPHDPGEAVSTVIMNLLKQVTEAMGEQAPPLDEVVHGTTLITNTLIERKGSKTALVTTQGMRDVLDIGREWRYDIYDLDIVLPQPLVDASCRVEIDERLSATGEVVKPVEAEQVQAMAAQLRELGVESVAVSLLHAYVNPAHERQIEETLKAALPEMAVSVSSGLASEINEFERTSTVVANAYVKPIVAEYLHELSHRIDRIHSDIPLRIMVSSGGFTSATAAAESPIFLLESGPAAGVLSALNTARQNQVEKVLAFDMGGTTAKAGVSEGEPPIAHSFECSRVERFKRGSGLPILIPSIELIEIGAGGGSIAYCNKMGLLNIGPESAGSVPGPACYGKGGENPTVTDADLMLGYLNPHNFLGGEMTLSLELARLAMSRLAGELGMKTVETAAGICNMVNENMASAARIHIAENGYDPRDFTMVATGGAGPLHAVDVARKLRIPRVLIPIAAGAGSCLGMLAAPARVDKAWTRPSLLSDVAWHAVRERLDALKAESLAELETAGALHIEWVLGIEMRYAGQGANVSVSLPYGVLEQDGAERVIQQEFERVYKKLYGHLVPNARSQVMTWRLTGKDETKGHHFEWGDSRIKKQVTESESREIYLPVPSRFQKSPVYDRYSLPAGTVLAGPLILEERESTIVVAVESEVRVLDDLTISVTIKEFE
ncbi:MAG: hydantoinase/oxoprolinase family protein [Pigmentiphaga sp.]|nr:hydantoinase/oxoprolinase family protein [Pigmentiphaga sp.]